MGGELSLAVAFGAGVVSFLSPCVLPLFPSYLSFITGLTFDELAEPDPGARGRVRRLTILHSLLFILGFMLVFVALGASATAIGQFLRSNQTWIRQVAGLVIVLLFLSMRGWPQTLLVLTSLPFAVAGSVWLLSLLHYNLSTAVWVGLIAVAGVAAETGIVMVVYLDEAFERFRREGRIQVPDDVDQAVIEGASARVRPLVMTVATTVLGLMPLLWESGIGADVSARTAAPVVGGLWSCMLLTLLVLPAAYAIWRRAQVHRGLRQLPQAP